MAWRPSRPPGPPTGPPPPAGGSGFEAIVIGVVVAYATAAGAVWAGGALAAWAADGRLDAALADAAAALPRLPSRLADPAGAWPEHLRAALPGPSLYWPCQVAVVAAALALAAAVLRWRLGRRERDGLGVERSGRFAARRDLRPLVVRRASRGRVVLGRAYGRLLATEPRTSICVVGPTQSGKTTALAVPALLELGRDGGAVLALSVKGDLYEATHRRRRARGEVKVFDPTGIKVSPSDTWSPLGRAATIAGAQGSARSLFELAARSGVTDADYWMDSGTTLLWPLLWVAAHIEDGTMADVVRWVTLHDRPHTDAAGNPVRSLVGEHLSALAARARTDDDPGFAPEHLEVVATAARGTWEIDPKPLSSIYSTVRNVIDPWSGPEVAAASATCDITPDWLLGGDNTVYLVSPSHDQARLQRVFASMVSDLLHAAFDKASRQEGGELPRPLLVVLDEAANICPVKELPVWCSTCASHGITLLTIWQDRSQQRARYGPDGAETIWNNSGARLVLSGTADRATNEVVRDLGTEEHSRVGSSVDVGSGPGRRSVSTQVATRPLVGPDSLRRQRAGQALLVYKHLPPVKVSLRRWKADRHLRRLAACRWPRFTGTLRQAWRWAQRLVQDADFLGVAGAGGDGPPGPRADEADRAVPAGAGDGPARSPAPATTGTGADVGRAGTGAEAGVGTAGGVGGWAGSGGRGPGAAGQPGGRERRL